MNSILPILISFLGGAFAGLLLSSDIYIYVMSDYKRGIFRKLYDRILNRNK